MQALKFQVSIDNLQQNDFDLINFRPFLCKSNKTKTSFISPISFLVTDVGEEIVGDTFRMLVTD